MAGGAFAGGGGGSESFASESLDLESVASEGLGFLEGEGAGAAHEEDARSKSLHKWLLFTAQITPLCYTNSSSLPHK